VNFCGVKFKPPLAIKRCPQARKAFISHEEGNAFTIIGSYGNVYESIPEVASYEVASILYLPSFLSLANKRIYIKYFEHITLNWKYLHMRLFRIIPKISFNT